MTNVQSFLKILTKAILWVAIIFVFSLVIIALLIRIPAVQNKIVHYATSFVSNKTHTKVEIKYISVSFPKSVVIKGLYLEDLNRDNFTLYG